MSLPKKKSRIVHVYDKQFRYLFKVYGKNRIDDDGGKEEPTVKLFIQEDCAKPGNVLEISLKHNTAFGPGDIVKTIQQSMILGWEPSKKGPAFAGVATFENEK